MTPSPILERFEEQVGSRGDQAAIVQGDQALSFRDLKRRMGECAGLLRSRGVGPGDRILVYVPPSPDLYALLLGIWHLGAVAVFVDAWTSRRRLGQVVDLAKPRLFVGIPKAHLLRILNPSTCRIPSLWWWRGRSHPALLHPPADVDPRSTALVTFTTGTTGSPKGADRSHEFLMAQHHALSRSLDTRAGSRNLATLPIFALHDLASGAICQLASIDPARPDSLDVPRFLDQLRRCDTAVGSPAVFLGAARSLEAADPTVRTHVHIGGAAVFPSTIQELSRAFPNATWSAVYGSTEAEPIASIDGRILAESPHLPSEGVPAGRVDPSLRWMILAPSDHPIEASTDHDLARSEVPPGEAGEIVVSGDHVLAGYWNDPAATARHKIRTAERIWHRTGDAGRVGPDGSLFLLGRVSERFHHEGRTHYPMPIQRMLQDIEGVLAASALEHRGSIHLVVEALHPSAIPSIRARILDLPWEFPFLLHFRPLPRDPRHRSKVDPQALRRKLDGWTGPWADSPDAGKHRWFR